MLRASSADRLSLITIGWLHAKHSATALYPAAFTDGDCGVWPFTQIPPVYVFPSAEQRGLLYQPLLFHEFGHLLYACHKAEMDDLVGELQKQIEDSLTPNVQRNDRHAATQASERQMIVDTWYKWTQELFCDAVGLTIGGPAFLWAFSGYLGTMDRGDFYRPPESLRYSSHPIKWLRVKLLIERARAAGYEDTAREVEEEWSAVAMTMNVREDYHGFYAAGFHRALVKTLDDMLTEADPLRCTNEGADAETFDLGRDELPFLFNAAWNSYFRNPETYLMGVRDREDVTGWTLVIKMRRSRGESAGSGRFASSNHVSARSLPFGRWRPSQSVEFRALGHPLYTVLFFGWLPSAI